MFDIQGGTIKFSTEDLAIPPFKHIVLTFLKTFYTFFVRYILLDKQRLHCLPVYRSKNIYAIGHALIRVL